MVDGKRAGETPAAQTGAGRKVSSAVRDQTEPIAPPRRTDCRHLWPRSQRQIQYESNRNKT